MPKRSPLNQLTMVRHLQSLRGPIDPMLCSDPQVADHGTAKDIGEQSDLRRIGLGHCQTGNGVAVALAGGGQLPMAGLEKTAVYWAGGGR